MKRVSALFLVLLALFTVMLFSACDEQDDGEKPSENCTHTWGEWQTVTAATCVKPGEKKRICTFCLVTETTSISATGEHSVRDGVCTVCGEKQPTDGLRYILNSENTAYGVKGIGTATDVNIVIPATYNGKPVTGIASYAFENCSSIKSVTIPSSVTHIGLFAFSGCSNLTSITIPSSVTEIGYSAFENCSSLTSITIPSSVTSIGSYAFCGCSSLTSVIIPEGVTSIESGTFRDCSSLTSITIPEGVTSIDLWAFLHCSNLTRITIPSSVNFVSDEAFLGCNSLMSATFENTSGWWYTSSITATSGTVISAADLEDTSTAARYLRSTYCGCYWNRS